MIEKGFRHGELMEMEAGEFAWLVAQRKELDDLVAEAEADAVEAAKRD